MILLEYSKICLNSFYLGTLFLQIWLWILCGVNGEEQLFSVEVRTWELIITYCVDCSLFQ